MFLRSFQIVGNHFRNHLSQRDFRLPAQFFVCLCRIAQQRFHFRRTEIAWVDGDHHIPRFHPWCIMPSHRNHNAFFIHALTFKTQLNTELGSGHFHKLTDGILHASGDHEIFRLFLLQHHPLHPDVVFGMSPVTQRIHVAKVQTGLQSLGNVGNCASNFACDEGFAATRRFMVKQNAVTGIHAIRFTVIDGDPVGVQFGDGIGRSRIERCRFFLRDLLNQTVQFRGGSLIETGFLFQPQEANRFQQTQCADPINISSIFWRIKRHRHVAHCAQVIDFIRLNLLQNAGQIRGVRQIAIMQMKFGITRMRVLVNMVYTFGIK